MKRVISIIPLLLLIFAVCFNLYFLFPETKLKTEVNDGVFAFGLIYRMNVAWNEGQCPLSVNCLPSLFDHWNSQWAMGFPLPHFYQHIPDLAVVMVFKFLNLFSKISLWTTFEWFKYLMLSLVPLSYFVSAKKFGLNNLTAAFSALVSTQISTQYLYGTDYNALVWRGSGMYTQLWGIFFLPLAVSSIYQFISNFKPVPSKVEGFQISNFASAVILLSLVISSHVVFGFIALGSAAIIPFVVSVSLKNLFKNLLRLFTVFLSSFILLLYWLIPLLKDSAFRNKSIWDDINKFDSFGFLQIVKWFLNGELFDANRLPVLTLIVITGLFLCLYLWSKQKQKSDCSLLLFFPVILIFWFLLYFGRKTWGPIIDIIPLMEDMHIHRLINGIHFAGIFIIGITLAYFVENSKNYFKKIHIDCSLLTIILILIFLVPVFKERKEYLEYNTKLIIDYDKSWETDNKEFQKVLDFFGTPPTASRIYPGRPGNWGNDFYVGSTKVYLELAQRGHDTFAFLPETWSLNSDIEQYFDENKEEHYNTFNVGYFLAPPEQKAPDFAKKVFQAGKYIVYKIDSSRNFDFIQSPLAISVNKTTFLNPQIAWLKSDWPKNHLFPLIKYNSSGENKNYYFLDSSTYYLNGQYYPLFNPNPFSTPQEQLKIENLKLKIEDEVASPSSYSSTVDCSLSSCNLLLKVTFHPYWQAKIDDSSTQISMVSPSFMSISVPSGSHKVEFVYKATTFKAILIYISFTAFLFLLFFSFLTFIIHFKFKISNFKLFIV